MAHEILLLLQRIRGSSDSNEAENNRNSISKMLNKRKLKDFGKQILHVCPTHLYSCLGGRVATTVVVFAVP